MLNISKLIPEVSAHCDVPCGVYEVDTMRNAAYTCLKMIDKLEELGEVDSPEKHNTFVRIIMTKEKHAGLCKEQIYILWSDYFKPEHLEKFPDLHQTFWQAAKQAGKVKQTVSRDEANALVEAVAGLSKMFADSKS